MSIRTIHLIFYNMSDQSNKNACDLPLDAKNIVIDIVVTQQESFKRFWSTVRFFPEKKRN